MHMGTQPVNSKVTVIQLIQCVVLLCRILIMIQWIWMKRMLK